MLIDMKNEQSQQDEFASMGITREQYVDLLASSANDGDAMAQFQWGKELMRGELVRKDEKEALRCFSAAAQQGHAEAQFRVGYALFFGIGSEVNEDEATYWMVKAAEQDVPNAQFFVGLMHLAAISGWPQDIAEARQWMALAAQKGYTPAENMLAALDEEEPMSVAHWRNFIDEQRACYQVDAENLFKSGMEAYFRKTEEDDAVAVAFFRRAAELGHAKAQMMLGVALREGKGCAKDEEEVLKWIEKAARQGLLHAQEELGYYYTREKPDFAIAHHWLIRAAAQGSATAMYDLGYFGVAGAFGEVDYVRAAEYFSKAVELGHWPSMVALSLMYEYGKGCEQDEPRSIALEHSAIKYTDDDSLVKFKSRFARMLNP